MKKELIQTPIRSDFLPVVTRVYHQVEFIKFARWYGTPSKFREPKTQKEFSKSIGVCVDTLTDWKRNPHFSFFVWQSTSEWIKDHVPDLIGGLYSKAISEKCNARDVEFLLKLSNIEINNKK